MDVPLETRAEWDDIDHYWPIPGRNGVLYVMANWNDPQPSGWSQAGLNASAGLAGRGAVYDAGLRRYMLSIYNYMASGILLSGIVALLFASSAPVTLARLAEVRARLRSLKALEKELARMSRACEGGEVGSCRVIEVLSDHDLCEVREHPPA